MWKQYKKFDIAVTLAKMREFPVYVSGFVHSPGPVMATALDSVFNVIAQAGGITKAGRLRNIVLKRANGTSRTIDLYNVLISGKSADIQVREGDSIFVPHIGPVAAIAGAVKRPGIYELKGERTVGDLVRLAGGLLPSANTSAISILRFQGDQRTLIDGSTSGQNVETMPLEDGDLVSVDAVRDYVRNEVKIDGEVMYPGSYSLERVGTLRHFLELAKLLPDTDLYYGRIYRTGPGGVQENLTFSPKDVLDGTSNVTLKSHDRVVLYPFGKNLSDVNFDNFPNTVTLEGDIRYPGMYAWKPGMKLSEIFSKANYLVDTNAQYAVVVRQEIGSDKQTIETFSPTAVADGKANITLQPLDRVRFFPKTINKPIEVSGAVQQSKVIQYYDGIDLIDVLRTVKLDADPTKMKAYIYRESEQQPTAAAALTTGSPGGPGLALPIGVAPTTTTTPGVTPSALQSGAAVAPSSSTLPPTTGGSTTQQPSQSQQTQQTPQSSTSSSSQGQSGAAGTNGNAQASPPPQKPSVVYLDDFLTKQSVQTVPLQPGDRIVFAMVGPNEKAPQVVVRGQVENPGAYLWRPGMHLSDVLKEAGGYTSNAYPEGLVLLRKSAAELQRQQLNRAEQELRIALEKNIQQSASGLATSQATSAQSVQLQIQAQQAQLQALRSQIASVLGRISIQMPKTLKELAGSPQDLLLEKGDVVFVPTTPTYVQIIGDVYNPVTVAYQPGLRVRDYLDLAGGPTNTAQLKNSYAILADGTIVSARQKRWRLFAAQTIENDRVTPGETIVIAQKPTRPNETLPIIAQVSTIVGSIASTALNVMAILKL